MAKERKATNLEKLDYAILKTLSENEQIKAEELIRSLLYNESYSKVITAKDNARYIIESLSREDILKEIVKQALRVSVADNRFGILSKKAQCIKLFDYLKAKKIKSSNSILSFIKSEQWLLDEIALSFSRIRYDNRESINLAGLDNYSSLKIIKYLIYLDDKKGVLNRANITNLNIFDKTINRCREDIVRGSQLKKGNVEYTQGKSLFAASIVGRSKVIQEDSVLLVEHPKNKKFKLLMVADGVGGHYNGGEASSYTAKCILSWFETINNKYYENIKNLPTLLNAELQRINKKIARNGDGRGTTFVCGIVGSDNTIVTSIGDSRAYITRDDELIQVSKDDSRVQEYYEQGIIEDKDDMRFHRESNYVTQCLGIHGEVKPHTYLIRNDEFDKLILVSDGVSDCLSDSQMLVITKNTPKEEIARALVEKANSNTSQRKNRNSVQDYYQEIPGGKDNTTAAVYSK